MKKYRPAVYLDSKEEMSLKLAVLRGKQKNINEFCKTAILDKARKINEKEEIKTT